MSTSDFQILREYHFQTVGQKWRENGEPYVFSKELTRLAVWVTKIETKRNETKNLKRLCFNKAENRNKEKTKQEKEMKQRWW